jgi:hypothetical protein
LEFKIDMAAGGINQASRAEIERIVRQVLAEMGGASREHATARSLSELVVASQVVSTKELEGKLDGVERIVVPRGAVVTPSARDLLRERKITIASAVSVARAKWSRQIVLGVAETGCDAASLVGVLSGEGVMVERLPNVGLVNVVDELCQHVSKGGAWGLILTGQTAAAVCLANRHSGVRAASAANATAIVQAVSSVDANVLAIDPSGKSGFEWKRLIRAWLGGKRNCPADVRERLK